MDNNYFIQAWGAPYFTVNPSGHIAVRAKKDGPEGDLYELVKSLVERGIEAPMLIRIENILNDRVKNLRRAFADAIKEFNYQNDYLLAYPVKVNPLYHLLNSFEKDDGHPLSLEVGSKPELIAVLTATESQYSLLLCNGYKDAHYIELALLARKLGRRSFLIIEQPYELPLVIDIAKKLNIEAEIGLRMKPVHKGSGRWSSSSGEHAKFGLNADEIVVCLEQLKSAGKLEWLKLLHFHIGSQITSIDAIKKALDEGARMFTQLYSLCPSLCFFDAGGGLGIDYEGNQTTSDSSVNYSIEEYARDVVYAIGEACQNAAIPVPAIITESGRALVAHHCVLITEVIDVTSALDPPDHLPPSPTDHDLLTHMRDLYLNLTSDSCLEVLHDAQALKEDMLEGFMQGSLTLIERAHAEKIYRMLLAKIRQLSKKLSYIPEDLENLDQILYDTYFCNFSVFQSLPDSWAIEQIFPIMPIHRLNEPALRQAILADLSCDSDGKIDRFLGGRQNKRQILLHPFHNSPYYIGIFLVGAYQEIMGGLHNLFGDTNVVHVELEENGAWKIKHVVEGDTIEEVLNYVQYNPKELIRQLRHLIEKALKEGRLSNEESAKLQKRFKESLESYTYLII